MRGQALFLLVGAVGISTFGDLLGMVPILLHVQSRSGSGLAVAAVFVALWGPMFLFAGPAGFLVDRYDARRILFLTALTQAGIAVALAFTSSVATTIVLTALLGTGAALALPAEFTLIPGVAGNDIGRANSYVETSRALGFALGPFAGGLLAAAGGMRLGLLADAGTFLVVAAVALLLPSRTRTAARGSPGRARDGAVFLARDSILRVVLGAAFVSLLFMTACAPAEVFFAKDVLGAGDTGYGVLLGTWTAGMVLGGLLLGRRLRGAVFALFAIAVQSTGILVPTLWLVLAWACAWFLVGGVAHGTKNVLVRTLIHERVPAELHGRAFAAYNGLRNFAEVFAVLGGGALVIAAGARWTMALAGALPLATGLVALARFAAMRRNQLLEPASALTASGGIPR
jgi:MFS family permease